MQKICFSRKMLPACAMLGVGLLVTVFASLQVKQSIEQDAVRRFAFACDQVTLKIQDRLSAYSLLLRGGTALFAASNTVDRHEWRAYVEMLQVERSLPGVQGIGFAQVIPADELASHIARVRGEGFPEYTVRPSGRRASYTSIIYLEPFRNRNLRAFGFDMFTNPVRRAAMEHARDTDEAALSGKVELLQETGTEVQAGTLMYVPVYRNGMPRGTPGQRRAALIGWIYSPFRMTDLMTGILQDMESYKGKAVALHIYDGRQATPATLLFDAKTDRAPNLHSLFYQQRTIDFNGHQWLLIFDRPSTIFGISYADAWATLIGGLALSSLLFGLMLSMIRTRANAARIANKLTEEIRCGEKLLKESEKKFRSIFESASDCIELISMDGHIIDLNHVGYERLGYTKAEMQGKRLAEFGTSEYAARLTENMALIKRKNHVTFETACIRKDGSIMPIEVSARIIELDGQPTLLSISRDITAWKLAEQKLNASYRRLQQLALHLDNVREEEQGRIAREIHDEMGATLTVLKMRVHWLASQLPPEMAQLTAEAEQIDKLVSDAIHTMRHVVSQLIPTQLHDLGFAAAVEFYVQNFQKHTGIECGLVFPEEKLSLDKNQSSAMFRILQESLNNVAKHAQATKVSILYIDRNCSLILLVKDNGVGFDRNTHKHNSFGLLGIRERAMVVNGKARISSKPGKGTHVVVSIPLAGK
ncbi:MAG: CHASE domain-containing protein [Gallionella sp.]|jgi:PAS domain S-box-containing protein